MPATISQFDDERILNLKENPCPYCGSLATGTLPVLQSFLSPMQYYSYCSKCKARGPIKDYPDLATEAWNSVKGRVCS